MFYERIIFQITYWLNSRKTTQMMTNMRAIPTRTPIIAGSIVRIGSTGSCLTAEMFIKKFICVWKAISNNLIPTCAFYGAILFGKRNFIKTTNATIVPTFSFRSCCLTLFIERASFVDRSRCNEKRKLVNL